ncbi:glycosyl hydrolase family 18 protein [Fictibacillus sp. UD]|uniref:LysM peptidoglycan-binding domain-containing protein n=1 Tax=Fictibacillus sp. UD TaxID=3038777 RepID=UPI0037475EF1
MYKFTLIIAALFASLCHSKQADGAEPVSVGTVSASNTAAFTSSELHSPIVTTLVRGEEFPILKRKEAIDSELIHTVATGDTLYLVAKQYGVSVNQMKRANRIIGSRLYVGQRLIIPNDLVNHRIKKKDSLWKIARTYNVSIDRLIKNNDLDAIVLQPGTELKIPEGFYQVQLLGGKTGWVQQSAVKESKLNRFNLGWKYNGKQDSYQKQLHIDGLDVVSPRWYTLSYENLISLNEDDNYAVSAAKAGKHVWPLFGNRFDPELTDFILSDAGNRQKVIRAIKKSLVKTKSQGINVDFENIDPKNKKDYVTFIQELKKELSPYGIEVSVDVSRENDDPFWSGSLDRAGLGKAADYIVLMGYDEHWGSSPKAGSVASLPWTDEGIKLLLREVPAHKVLLGVPFYTREWITDKSGKVRSVDRTITETEKLIQEKGLTKKWDHSTSQNYVAFMENGEKHQIWVEDETSMKLRYDLVKKYHLRGTAAWYVGGGPEGIWDALK